MTCYWHVTTRRRCGAGACSQRRSRAVGWARVACVSYEGEKPFPQALKAWTTLRVAHPTAIPLSPAKPSPRKEPGRLTLERREGANGKPLPRVRPQLHLGASRLRSRRRVGRSLSGPAGRARKPAGAAFVGLGYPPPTPSRQKPLGADFGGSRSIGCTRTPRAESLSPGRRRRAPAAPVAKRSGGLPGASSKA